MSGINEELGNEVMDAAKSSGKGVVDFLSKLLLESMKTNTFLDQTQKSIQSMMEYIKKGGEIRTSSVSLEDSQIYENYLKAMNVPYVKCQCVDPHTREERNSYIYRAVDEALVRKAREKFLNEMGYGLSEVDPREFIKLNKNEDIIAVIQGLDRVEIEAFRQNVPAQGVQFAVKNNGEPGKYDILFKKMDAKIVDNLIKDMYYDLAGAEGKEYREKITNVLDEKAAFDLSLTPGEGETIYLVDQESPNNFISVTNHGFSIHHLEKSSQRNFDNSVTEIIKDKNSLTEVGYNREKLMKYVAGMTNAVVLKESEFGIIKGIGQSGEAIPLQGEAFMDKFKEVSEKVKSAKNYYKPEKIIPSPDKPEKMYSYENIPVHVLDEIREKISNQNLKSTVLIGDKLAYSEKDRRYVEANIIPLLYNDLSDLKKIEAELFYEGKGRITLSEPTDKLQYLVCEKYPELVVEIGKDNVKVINNGSIDEKFDRNSVDFAEQLRQLTQRMNNPVALTEEEMRREKEKREAIIRQRSYAKELRENEATEYLKSQEKTAKEILHMAESKEDARYDLSERQREAIDRAEACEIKEVYIDQEFYEKTMEETVEEKLNYEMEYEERHSTSFSR